MRPSLIPLVVLLSLSQGFSLGAQTMTRHVVLISIDGLRHQELFGGVESTLLRSDAVEDREVIESHFWDDDPHERRRLLMPFVWSTVVNEGILIGERERGSAIALQNPQRVSYPSYAEMLTGFPQPGITGNDPVQIETETVLELVRRVLGLARTDVAVFTSWNHFPYIVEHRPGTLYVDAGRDPTTSSAAPGSEEMLQIRMLQARTLSPWSSVRQNSFTEALAAAHVREYHPRLLYVAFDETDEWAHSGRYDRAVQAIHHADQAIARLWDLVQSIEIYRGKTTFIITTDHGRGRGLSDWTSHGPDVEGADETWLAVVGPDTPARGSLSGHAPLHQGQIAATIVRFFGISLESMNDNAAEPIDLVFR